MAALKRTPSSEQRAFARPCESILIRAIIAAVLGFGFITGTAAWIAKVLFLVFLILFVITLVMGRKPKI